MASETLALSPSWLTEHLPRSLYREGERPGEILGLQIGQVRQGAKRTTAVYHLTLRTAEHEVVEQSYVGYVAHDGHQRDQDYRAITSRAAVEPRVGRAVSVLPEANLVFVAFPNDRRLDLLSAAELTRWGDTLVPGRYAADAERARVTLLRYVPDKRVTSRCVLPVNDPPGTWSCIAKQYADRARAGRLHRNLEALAAAWPELAARTATRFTLRLPRALAFDRRRGIVFMEEAGGRDLSTVLADVDLAAVMPAVGSLLAILHLMPEAVRTTVVSKRVTWESELAETRAAIADIGQALPGLKTRLDRLLARLSAATVDAGALTVLLHGSVRLNHVLLDGDTLTLLDLESLRLGHPAYDMANFLSSLHYAEAEGRVGPLTRQVVTRDVVRGYLAAVPWSLGSVTLLWFLASLLINKQACKYVRHAHGDRTEKVQRMLGLAERAVATAAAWPDPRPAEHIGS